jgi:hypothetical protein
MLFGANVSVVIGVGWIAYRIEDGAPDLRAYSEMALSKAQRRGGIYGVAPGKKQGISQVGD